MKPIYWTKFPGKPFIRPRSGHTRSLDKKRRQIERNYASGYTNRPYVQLVEETDERYRVIGEWMPGHGWTGPLQAAGLAATPGPWC